MLFSTYAERNKCKFCATVNNAITNGGFFMKIIQKQCTPISTNGAEAMKARAESKRKLGAILNKAVRRIFEGNDWGSAKDILFRFKFTSAFIHYSSSHVSK